MEGFIMPDDSRVLSIRLNDQDGVDVTGFLQFTKTELEALLRAACAMLASKRHPKRHVIPPEIPAPEHVQAFVAEQERRNLW